MSSLRLKNNEGVHKRHSDAQEQNSIKIRRLYLGGPENPSFIGEEWESSYG